MTYITEMTIIGETFRYSARGPLGKVTHEGHRNQWRNIRAKARQEAGL